MKKKLVGFKVTFQDGFVQDIRGGVASIPDEIIRGHGHVRKAKEIEEK
jgi:hypothetical protein